MKPTVRSVEKVTTTHLKILRGSKEQYDALYEKGLWICGNERCIHPKTGERTIITKPMNAYFVKVLTPARQELEIEMKSIRSLCRFCGTENSLYQTQETQTQEFLDMGLDI